VLGQMLSAEAFGVLLVLARIGALFMLAPALGDRQIPQRIRLGAALAISLIIYAGLRDSLPALPAGLGALVGLILVEILIGAMIALAPRLLSSALNIGGTIIAFQNSLAFTQQFDPTQGTQSALTANFMTFVGIVLIFAADLHLLMIEAMLDSYMKFPPGQMPPVGDFTELVVDWTAASFLLGMQIAAPFIAFGLIFNFGLGLTARLMPQLPVFFIALPANIYLGFVILLIVLPTIMLWFLRAYEGRLMTFIE